MLDTKFGETMDYKADPQAPNPATINEGPEAASTIGKDDRATGHTSSWKDIEIRFTSEHRVQIFVRDRPRESVNFADMGFEDRRGGGGKPILAWALLIGLSQNDGIYPAAKISGDQSIQKRASSI
jgi:hypothetical protein